MFYFLFFFTFGNQLWLSSLKPQGSELKFRMTKDQTYVATHIIVIINLYQVSAFTTLRPFLYLLIVALISIIFKRSGWSPLTKYSYVVSNFMLLL